MPDSRFTSGTYAVAIVGSRESDEVDLVLRIVQKLAKTHSRLTVVSGGARGVDQYARGACWHAGFHFCNAEWNSKTGAIEYRVVDPAGPGHQQDRHFVEFPVPEGSPGKAAFAQRAYARNIEIVRAVDMLIAVYAPGKRTPGTTHSIQAALQARKVVHVWHPDGGWVKYGEGRWDT